MDIGHDNREIATDVSPKQKCALEDLRRYGSGKPCGNMPLVTAFALTFSDLFPSRLSDASSV